MEKSFSVEKIGDEESTNYRDEILSIINDMEEHIRSVKPDQLMHKELHEQRNIDTRAEISKFEPIRRDIYKSFGVPTDDDHVYIHQGVAVGTQRALRAFFILIDTLQKQTFYGEGRIDHNTLLENLAEKLGRLDGESSSDSIISALENDSLRYLVFKGFLSTKEFSELSDSSRKVLETPILDKSGNKINTPSTWFVTGHNVPEK